MEIKDLNPNTGNVDIVAKIVNKEEPRTFEKFGKSGRVCKATLKDESGEVKLTLWNDDVDSVNLGDKVHVQNGWCSEYQGEKQLSSGKFGKIEVVEKGEQGSSEVFSNDPGMAQGMPEDEETQPVEEEELVE